MGDFSAALQQPEYVHVALNHLPLIGLFVAMLALAIALVARNRTAILIGLALVAVLSLSVWPVSYFGGRGYDRVLSMADSDGAAFLEHHAELAERWAILYYATALIAVVGFALAWKWPKSLKFFSITALLLATASLAAGLFIAKAGGAIRHREFRFSPPPEHHAK